MLSDVLGTYKKKGFTEKRRQPSIKTEKEEKQTHKKREKKDRKKERKKSYAEFDA